MASTKLKVNYGGSTFWLIFWIFVFFPVALVLLFTGGRVELGNKIYYSRYEGSRNWLCFWVIFCFPIAFILLLVNGIALFTDDDTASVPIV